MGRLIAQRTRRPVLPRRRRTWNDDGFGGIREAERTVDKAQRDSDARERSGQQGLGRENRDKTPSDAVRENKNGATIGTQPTGKAVAKAAGRAVLSHLTGGASEVAIRVGNWIKNQPAGSSHDMHPENNVRTNDRPVLSAPRPIPAPTVQAPIAPVTIVAPAPVAAVVPVPTAPATLTPYYIAPAGSAQPQMSMLPATLPRTEASNPQAWQPQAAPAGWMDQESIPGVKNLYLVLGAGGMAVLLVAMSGGRKDS